MGSFSDIDIRAGLPKEEFINEILNERRREFAFEGKRRFVSVRVKRMINSIIMTVCV